MDPGQLADILNLVRIFPKNQQIIHKTDKRVILVAHLYYDDLWEYAFRYFQNVPEYVDILITTDTKDKKEFFTENMAKKLKNNTTVLRIKPRGRDMASLLVAARDIIKDYDYFCFMHDKKSQGKEFISVGGTFRDVLWENNLASSDFIESIIKEFDENPSLGVIVPPRIYHGTYFHAHIKDYWVKNFERVCSILCQMGIETPISKDIAPLSIGNCFWAKYDALEQLFNLYFEYADFTKEPMPSDGTLSHALERIYPYVATSNGYYTETVMTEQFARADVLNHRYMFGETLKAINVTNQEIYPSHRSFLAMYKLLKKRFKDMYDYNF